MVDMVKAQTGSRGDTGLEVGYICLRNGAVQWIRPYPCLLDTCARDLLQHPTHLVLIGYDIDISHKLGRIRTTSLRSSRSLQVPP